jgi:mono/diheme cytochrome c family protein
VARFFVPLRSARSFYVGALCLILGPSISAALFAQGAPPPGRGAVAAVTGAGQDPASVERGAKLFASNCAGCHGVAARGSAGAPDLVRSILVLDDEKGILIAPVIRNGRPDLGMPKSTLPDAAVADIVSWLHVQTWSAGHRSNYEFKDVLTGNAKQGEAYFNQHCASCHSATGDLKGIGSRYDAFSLQARWLQPRGVRRGAEKSARRSPAPEGNRSTVSVIVTPPNSQPVTGTLVQIDDFSVSIRDSAGEYHSFLRDGDSPKVEVRDPLRPHSDLLRTYQDADIHNVTAYLASLK